MDIGKKNVIPRLCVAWPFQETLIFDFAGTPEEYGDACLFGTLTKTWSRVVKLPENSTDDTGLLNRPQLDSFA